MKQMLHVTRVNWDTHKQDFDFDNVYLHFSTSSKVKINYEIIEEKLIMHLYTAGKHFTLVT